jgi:hypothetical protein
VNAEEARNRLLQAYDEEVTIPRTLSQRSGTAAFKPPKKNHKTAGQPPYSCASAKRRAYGVAVGCVAGAGEDAGDA